MPQTRRLDHSSEPELHIVIIRLITPFHFSEIKEVEVNTYLFRDAEIPILSWVGPNT